MTARRDKLMIFAFGVAAGLAGVVAGRWAYAVSPSESETARKQLAEMAKYDQLSVLFRTVAKAVDPAVVEVRVTKKVASGGPEMNEMLRRYFGEDYRRYHPAPREGGPPQIRPGLGSGVIVDAKNGYVLTNYHVVADAESVQVVLSDGRKVAAKWVRTDKQTDLAVIKIATNHLVEAPLGNSDRMDVGDWVLAIGSPRGLAHTVTAGIISAKGRTTGSPNMYENLLQTDASINRGNSGGPLVNMKGEVIGINNAIMTYSGGNEGIGFSIPSNMVRRIMTQLVKTGKVVRGFLGVSIQNVDENLAKSFKLPHTRGALVTTVAKGTPAAKGKMKEGDFIISVAGRPVGNTNDLRNIVAGVAPGQTIPIQVIRDTKTITLKVTLTAQPTNMVAMFDPPRPDGAQTERFGLAVSTLTPELAATYGYKTSAKGVVITKVQPGTSAAEQGLTVGMLITQIQRKDVTTAREFADALEAKDDAAGVRLRVTDTDGGRRFVFITPKK